MRLTNSEFDQDVMNGILDLLTVLTPREEEIIKRTYGLIGGKVHTAKEIGAYYNLSEDVVNQIANSALLKLFQNKENEKLLIILMDHAKSLSDPDFNNHLM